MNGALSSWSFRDRCVLAVVFCLSALFIVLRIGEFPVGAGMDDAYYIELARSLAEGQGPVIRINETGPGWRQDIFPLGFPLLLSPLALLAPASVTVFKLVPVLAAAALLPICLLLARPLGRSRQLMLAALVCLNPWVVAYAGRVFSDLPYAAVSLAAVLLFRKLDEQPNPGAGIFVAAVVTTGLAIMIRSIGLALPAAVALHWLTGGRWRRALIFGGALALVLLPHALAAGGSGGGLVTRAYLTQVLGGGVGESLRPALVADNLAGYLKELPVVMVPVFGGPLEDLASRMGLGAVTSLSQAFLGVGLLAGIVWGLIVTGRTHRSWSRFLVLYLAIYGAALLNFDGYPSGVQSRLLLPVLPLFHLLLLTAGEPGIPGPKNRTAWAGVILVLTFSLGHNAYRAAQPLNAGGAFIDPGRGAPWIRNNTEPGSVIMARWPLRQHIHFLRPVVGLGISGEKDLPARIEQYGVEFVLLDSFRREAGETDPAPLFEAEPGLFKLEHRDTEAGLRIFRVRKAP